ncbi:MAG: hypothetical protein Q9227_001813 [Pyrenula ochraceoflavens]
MPLTTRTKCLGTLYLNERHLFTRLLRRHIPTLHRHQSTRPPTAPKQFPNIKHIRQNVELYRDNCTRRNYKDQQRSLDLLLQNSEDLHFLEGELKDARKARNSLSAAYREPHTNEPEDGGGQTRIQEIKAQRGAIRALEQSIDVLENILRNLWLGLPNLTSPETPVDDTPKVLGYINYDPSSQSAPPSETAKSHVDIGTDLSLLDFTSSSSTSGWGFYFLANAAVLLEQALISYSLSVAIRHGFRPVTPPSLVYTYLTESCGFQPRDANSEQQIWSIAQSPREESTSKPSRSLSATAEIPLAGMHSDHALPESTLPLKLVGSSRCYRAEAGARGVDTKGLYRVHEFTKVELFAWSSTPPDTSPSDHATFTQHSTPLFDSLLAVQREILTTLGLPCRILEMPASDLGASAYRKIDIECLFPSRRRHNRDGGWGEVTSVSNCTDYQARRLNTRVLDKSGGRKRFAQTVNGTAVAVPRVLAAILEWGWREEEGGYVVVPECLRGWMGGLERIEKGTLQG